MDKVRSQPEPLFLLLNFLEVLFLELISLHRVGLLLTNTLDLEQSETVILNTLLPLLELVEFNLKVVMISSWLKWFMMNKICFTYSIELNGINLF